MSRLDSLLILSGVASALRALADGTVVFCYLRYGSRGNKANELLFHKTIPDLVLNIGIFVGRSGPNAGRHSALCQTQGAAVEWAEIVAYLWTAYACYCLVVVVYMVRNMAYHQRISFKLRAALYGIPFLLCAACWMMSTDGGLVFGDASVWCRIAEQYIVFRYSLFFFKVFLMCLFWLAVILAVRRLYIAHQRSASTTTRVLREKSIKRYAVTLTAIIATFAIGNITLVLDFFFEASSFLSLLINAVFSLFIAITTFAILYYSTFFHALEERHRWQTETSQVVFDDCVQLDPYFKLSADEKGRDSPSVHLQMLGEIVKNFKASSCSKATKEYDLPSTKVKAFLTRVRGGHRRSLGPGPFASSNCKNKKLLSALSPGIPLPFPSKAVLPSRSPDFPPLPAPRSPAVAWPRPSPLTLETFPRSSADPNPTIRTRGIASGSEDVLSPSDSATLFSDPWLSSYEGR